ncbi:hypothetical protein DOTSEDRAFT_51163 [Dothistroma septosporum NZE10]|uniref:Uncharacterized protein n=1 Tax=Dothistroma septosporum (strain NZE10 / CBS 128990) TaxID=675120 RepID=N1Q052_DOTSN|nr:hypothetical protein DOTSEDRAFT_51163 [Dothistroma septosporum NZE10]
MAQAQQSSPLPQADAVNDHVESHKSGGIRAQLKQKLFHTSHQDESSASHQADESPVADAENGNSGAEVLGLMRTGTSSNESSSGRRQSPALERHITAISESDDEDEQETGRDLPPQLKRHISSVPVHDYDSENEQPAPILAKPRKQDSGITGSDFDGAGILRISSTERTIEAQLSTQQSPDVAEHISMMSEIDEPRRRDSLAKLV